MGEIKKLDQSQYNEVIALSKFAFQYELSESEYEKRFEEADTHDIWGWIEDNKLAGKVHIIPLEVFMNGEIVKMGGINAVATWPEYRRQGIIKNLLYRSLEEMKKDGQILSFLAPFSFPFYRKYGWELAFTNKEYNLPIEHLKQDWQAQGIVKRVNKDISTLQGIYTTYANRFTGALNRTEKWWEFRVIKDTEHVAVAYDEVGQPDGYIIYHVKDEVLTVRDFAYTNLNGWKSLLTFMANHDSMAEKVKIVVPENDLLPFLLENPRFDIKTNHFFMARIVDVPEFLKQFPFEKDQTFDSLSIEVEDSFFDENSGVYMLTNNQGSVDVTSTTEETSDIQSSIQMLTMMFLGYKRPLDLYKLGLIQGDMKKIGQLEALIPEQQTYLAATDSF